MSAPIISDLLSIVSFKNTDSVNPLAATEAANIGKAKSHFTMEKKQV